MAQYRWRRALLLMVVSVGLTGCRDARESLPSPAVVVSSPYLAAAVRDVSKGRLEPASLSGPGQCPGHFDLRPAQVAQLAKARVLLRFDFQSPLDRKLQRAQQAGLRVVPIPSPEGMCIPAEYLLLCQAVAQTLRETGLLSAEESSARLANIARRMNDLTDQLHKEVEPGDIKNLAILASGHQANFCRFLGLNVIGTFTAGDNPAQLDALFRTARTQNISCVVGNAPEGSVLPNRLAGELGIPAVLFDNFPSSGETDAFDVMVRTNVDRLLRAVRNACSSR